MKKAAVPAIFTVLLLLAVAAVGEAQQSTKIPRIGYLNAAALSVTAARTEAFRQGLHELGYVEGKNIVIEWRSGEGNEDRLPALAAELVRLKVDVIVTSGPVPTRNAKEATTTIPIVMAQDSDPVGNGFVVSLARPGGNITGLSTLAPEISGNRLELLKEIVPRLDRVAVLWNPNQPGQPAAFKDTQVAAQALKVTLISMEARNREVIEKVLSGIGKERPQALFELPDPLSVFNRQLITEFAAKHKLPAMYSFREYVDAGGLMSYGTSFPDLFRRAATYVDKILKGTKPAELPVEQPMKFEFIINLKAAKQIGLTIPPNVLARADKVIR